MTKFRAETRVHSGSTNPWRSLRLDSRSGRCPQVRVLVHHVGDGLGGTPPPTLAEASDPAGSISFAEALEKQLGLKLEKHTRPEPVLVIDHIEEKPADN